MTMRSTRPVPTIGPIGGPLPAAVVRPLPASAVQLGPSGHLGAWQERNASATVPHCLKALETSGALDNFRRLLDDADPEHRAGPYRGFNFADSDVHKTLEAVAWEDARSGDGSPEGRSEEPQEGPYEATVRQVVDLLRRVQHPSGYLDSHVQGGAAAAVEHYADLRWGHELYVLGHLVQAGVARARATGADDLLDVAMAWADDVVGRLAAGDELFCGHPEVESALVELYRETGERAYLDAASRMIDLRGHGRLGAGPFEPAYHQDAVPVREATAVAGHAVRQLYLLAGVVDVYLETGDDELLAAARRLWDDAFGAKTYVTGGMGSRHKDESFGDPFELPPDRAYAESCAGVASAQWAWRMLLATGEGRFADALEHALYNVVAAAVSLDGTTFFYSNPLQVREGHDGSDEYQASGRRDWFACACCPPNIARLVASLHTMVATVAPGGALALHLYADATVAVPGGGTLTMRTRYPADGEVHLSADVPLAVPLALRVPGWADAAAVRLEVDGVVVDGAGLEAAGRDGYVVVPAGASRVRLLLPTPVRVLRAHPRVDAVRGCVAIARGPVVYCLEQADHPGVSLDDLEIVLPGTGADAPDGCHGPRPGPLDEALGVVPVLAQGVVRVSDGTALYRTGGDVAPGRAAPLRAVPYAVWGHREEGPMRVWIPVAAHAGGTIAAEGR